MCHNIIFILSRRSDQDIQVRMEIIETTCQLLMLTLMCHSNNLYMHSLTEVYIIYILVNLLYIYIFIIIIKLLLYINRA